MLYIFRTFNLSNFHYFQQNIIKMFVTPNINISYFLIDSFVFKYVIFPNYVFRYKNEKKINYKSIT